MIAWDPQILHWFLEASAHTGYHRDLAALLWARLGHFATAFDLGAGSGALSLELARLGVRVTAVEVQKAATDHLKALVSAAGLDDRVQVIQGDWTRLAGPPAEVGILSYCNGVCEQWQALQRLCQKRLVVLKGASSGPAPLFGMKGFPARTPKDRHESAASIRAALKGYGVTFTEEPHFRDFGQVLADQADLEDFLRRYYGERIAARVQEAAALCERLPDGRLYLPRQRQSALFLVNMEEICSPLTKR